MQNVFRNNYLQFMSVSTRTGKALYTKKARPPHRRFLAVRSMKMSDTKDIDNITTEYKSGEGMLFI